MSDSIKIPENVYVRGVRIKLLPTQQQEVLLTQFIGTRRFAYDWALEKRTETWLKEGRIIPLSELLHEFTLLRKEDDTLWLNDISCDVGKQAIKDLDNAFKRYFKMVKEPGYVTYTKNTIRKANINHREYFLLFYIIFCNKCNFYRYRCWNLFSGNYFPLKIYC